MVAFWTQWKNRAIVYLEDLKWVMLPKKGSWRAGSS